MSVLSCTLISCDVAMSLISGVFSGFIASFVFYMINKTFIDGEKNRIAQKRIKHELMQVHEDLRQIVTMSIWPFDFSGQDRTKTFVSDFCDKNLYDTMWSEDCLIIDFINARKMEISEIIDSLMNSYFQYMTDDQIEYVGIIMNSYFLSNDLKPNNTDFEPQYWNVYGCNQDKMAQSIYELYNKHVPQ